MKKTEAISMFRVIAILIIIALTAAISILYCFYSQLYLDEWLSVFFLDMLFLAILIFEMEYERLRKFLCNNAATTFLRVAGGYALCCILVVAFPYLPEFYRPVIVLPILMSALSSETIALCVGMYLNILFGVTFSGSYYELICYVCMTLFGSLLAKCLEEERFRIWISFLLLFISIMVPSLFAYLANQKVEIEQYFYGVACGLATVFVSQICFGWLRKGSDKELSNRLMDVMSEDDSYYREIKALYPADYQHAVTVSDIAGRCALKLGYNVSLCAAAGFYYRMGKWIGEPHVQNGEKKARKLCFPQELVQIIGEYYGEETLPTTPESALIHMVDALVIKMEALNREMGKSQWNHEMIIYQTLNEFSSSGLYDDCGMSMNQFLKVREFLVKEEKLR